MHFHNTCIRCCDDLTRAERVLLYKLVFRFNHSNSLSGYNLEVGASSSVNHSYDEKFYSYIKISSEPSVGLS